MSKIKEEVKKMHLKELMKDNKQILLTHGEKLYRLSITRRGKLILTAAY